MTRVALDGGGWFDRDAATSWEEDYWWNGHNHCSRATGSQWDHERLYRTSRGRWVIKWSSQWQGSRTSYRVIDAAGAAEWLIRNGHDVPAELRGDTAEQEV